MPMAAVSLSASFRDVIRFGAVLHTSCSAHTGLVISSIRFLSHALVPSSISLQAPPGRRGTEHSRMASRNSNDVAKANAFAQLSGGLSGFWGISTPLRAAKTSAAADLSNARGDAPNAAYGTAPKEDPIPSPLPSPPTSVALGDDAPPDTGLLPQAVQAAAPPKASPGKQVFVVQGVTPSGFWGVSHPA